ncbi:MAG: DUF3102 domain-containing protein [Ruminococcus sp.]|nr:DUF3102 domain-containing protein [Ruminococcus sp.]
MNNNEVMLRPEQEAFLITERIKDYGKIAVNAVCNIGKDLRRMKIENLYVHLGYENFEDYAEKEFQLKRRQAYQYISVFEKLGEEFVQSNAQLGITKLALLASANPEDRAELMETEDVPNMTAKELEDLLAKYKEQGEQLSFLQDQNAGLVKENEELAAKVDDAPIVEKEVIKEVVKEIPDKKAEKELAKVKKAQAAAEKELEKAKSEIESIKYIKEQMHEEAQRKIDELNGKIAELTKAAEKPAETTDKSNFKAMLTSAYKEITGLVEFIKSSEPADKKVYIRKALEVLNAGKESLKSIEIEVDIPAETEDD